MTCSRCQTRMRRTKATPSKPYHYRLSGLPDVLLTGIEVDVCPQCANTAPRVPRLGELHGVIAKHLTEKRGTLRGDEVRFLRGWAGFPPAEFARLIGVTRAELGRVERGTAKFGAASDRLARALALVARDSEAARQALLEAAAPARQKKAPRGRRFAFRGKRWKLAA